MQAGNMMKHRNIPTLKIDSFQEAYFTGRPDNADIPGAHKGFDIIRTDDHFTACKSAAQVHLLDFYIICLIEKGEGIYHFGADDYYLKENTLCFVSPWLVTSWHSQTSYQKGYCCAFSEVFFNEGMEDKHWLGNLPFFELNGNLALNLSDIETFLFASFFEDMLRESAHKNKYTAGIVRSMLHLLLRKAQALFPDSTGRIEKVNRADINLTQAFLKNCRDDLELLVTGKIKAIPSLTDHAARLFVSTNHMNDTVKAVTGRSAGQHIQQLTATHATTLLKQTTLSISEIADQLGFEDPSYFARFYKKQTGVTPTSFRKQTSK